MRLEMSLANSNVSRLATDPRGEKFSAKYTKRARKIQGLVMDGRDIGTVVFPKC